MSVARFDSRLAILGKLTYQERLTQVWVVGYVQAKVSQTFAPGPRGGRQLRQRMLVALVGVAIVLAIAYLTLIIATRVDKLFFPGQGFDVGGLAVLPGVADDGPGERINILVMGLDRRPGEGNAATRTDTMFILTADPQSKTAGILGIPRDLLVDIPFLNGGCCYQDRVNTLLVIGETVGYPGGGPGLAKQVIERNLEIHIDFYVIIDFEGFVEIIDELGGIDLFVAEEVNDPFYSRTELPGDYYPLHFEVGEHHMDGETALDYTRTRFGSSDLDRIRRQQAVIFAAIDKALERNLVNVDKLVGLWGRYKDAVQTDINDLQAPGFAALAAQIDPTRISALSLGAATVGYLTPDGAAVLLADPVLVQQMIEALFSDQRLLTEEARVEVQNGAGADGLASLVVDYLAAGGFPSRALTTANTVDGVIRPLTEIIDFSGKDYTVERLAGLLAVPPERIRPADAADRALRTTDGVDILVILGVDAQSQDFTPASGG